MFDLDAGKLVVFGIVALAVIPPKELPRVLRTVGKYVGQMRRMASDFQGQFMDAIKEADLESVKKEIMAINDEASKIDTSFDPASLMRDNITKAVETPTVYETVKAEPPAIAHAEPEPIAEAEPIPAEPLAAARIAEPAHVGPSAT